MPLDHLACSHPCQMSSHVLSLPARAVSFFIRGIPTFPPYFTSTASPKSPRNFHIPFSLHPLLFQSFAKVFGNVPTTLTIVSSCAIKVNIFSCASKSPNFVTLSLAALRSYAASSLANRNGSVEEVGEGCRRWTLAKRAPGQTPGCVLGMGDGERDSGRGRYCVGRNSPP